MPVLAIVGPTAVGKSDLAVRLADAWASPVEIVNADAMQLYRGLDIGTAKVDRATRERIPHHVLDIWDVTHRASVVEYAAAARAAIDDILGRGALPVVVGGSGLYLKAALDVLDVPATEPAVRAKYQRRLVELGPAALHRELAELDPAAAAAIEPGNGRRLVRALEVVELTGSFTARLPREPQPWRETDWIGLRADLPELDRRIADRVRRMWREGLAQEVEGLVGQGLREGPTAAMAVGYRECLDYLDGRVDQSQAVEATITRTRQLARRQLRWFRRDPRIRWLEPGAGPLPDQLRAVLDRGSRSPERW